jgi:uncharacterized protein DUF3306
MSGPDETDREKGFLARWSQRKQEAKQPEPKPAAPAPESDEPSGPSASQGNDATPEFDPSTLPNLEELTGSTDITAFLRKGVPEHLRNAALRKSWALDPAIRNYVNPALEYAYDWNTPGGVPGGGELDAGVDVARLVSQIMGESASENIKSNENPGDETTAPPAPSSEREISANPQPELPQSVRRSDAAAETEDISKVADAVEPPETQPTGAIAPQQPVRRHGTAKPIV